MKVITVKYNELTRAILGHKEYQGKEVEVLSYQPRKGTCEIRFVEVEEVQEETNDVQVSSVTNNIKKMAQHKIDLILGAYPYGYTKADWEPEDKKMYNRYVRILKDDKLHTKVMQDTIKYLQEEIYFGYGDGVIEPSEEKGDRHDGQPWVTETNEDINITDLILIGLHNNLIGVDGITVNDMDVLEIRVNDESVTPSVLTRIVKQVAKPYTNGFAGKTELGNGITTYAFFL